MINIHTFYLKLRKQLHYIYLLYAIPMVYMAAAMIPPFQNPDEPNHFMRVEQVSRGELVPSFYYKHQADTNKRSIPSDSTILYPKPGGFKTDKGILTVVAHFYPIQANAHVKVNDRLLHAAKDIRWGSGIAYSNFGNTAIYTPLVYAMPALGVALGRLLNLSVVKTLFISRLFNGALAITLSFFALLLARRSNILLFIVLLFPMTIELFASVSQDAVLISCSFLLVAIIDHAEFGEKPQYRQWHIYALIILMAIIGMAKPPYALFSIVFLFLRLNPKLKGLLLGVPFLIIATWLYIDRINLGVIFAPPVLHVNAKLQVLHIFQHPFRFAAMFFDVDKDAVFFNIKSFIGILGWLDANFSQFYYIMAFSILSVGFIIYGRFKKDEHFTLRIAFLIAVLASLIAVMSVQYITWTALDSPVLSGMQGRYLLPIFPFLALGLINPTLSNKLHKFKPVATYLIIIFPLVTAINLLQLLLSRYY